MGTQMMKEPYHRKRFISAVRFGNPFRHFVALLPVGTAVPCAFHEPTLRAKKAPHRDALLHRAKINVLIHRRFVGLEASPDKREDGPEGRWGSVKI